MTNNKADVFGPLYMVGAILFSIAVWLMFGFAAGLMWFGILCMICAFGLWTSSDD